MSLFFKVQHISSLYYLYSWKPFVLCSQQSSYLLLIAVISTTFPNCLELIGKNLTYFLSKFSKCFNMLQSILQIVEASKLVFLTKFHF